LPGRRWAILPLFLALLLLGILLYLLGWVTKAEVPAAWIRKGGGVLFVFGATLLLTRNIGIAILSAIIAYPVM